VKKGDTLIELRNRDIDIQLADIEGQILTNLAEQTKVQGQLSRRQLLKPAEERSLQAEKNELRVKYNVLIQKQELQKQRAEDLIIRSPIDGTVVSWDVEKTLRSRPIMTGQVLMEVADLDKPLMLEVELPEKREGHLDEYLAEQGLLGTDGSLSVTYILATDPDEPLAAVLELNSISMRADANEEHGAVIKMRAIPDQASLRELQPRPGAKVIAKIYCGRRSSGFVFFHEIYEWCHKFFF
jgi:multidrug resistance efflux pump